MVYRQPDIDYTTAPPESIPEELRELVAAWRDPNSFSNRAFAVTDPAEIDFNSPEVQAAELPASNGIGTARALARMYAALVGEVDGVRLFTPETLASAAKEQATGADRVMVVPSLFGSEYREVFASPPRQPTSARYPRRRCRRTPRAACNCRPGTANRSGPGGGSGLSRVAWSRDS